MKRILLLLLAAAPMWAQFGNATRIQGNAVKSPLACSDTFVLTWVTANNRFECLAVSAGGNPAFNNVTTGTNTNALLVGNGGTFGATGTGAITATKLGSGSYIPKLTTGTPSAAAAADVVGLFSTCSGTQYLGADGACHSAGAGTVINDATLTANLPLIGAGTTHATVGTRSGNTTQYVTTTGAQTSGDCVKIDANGNHIANGSACGGGSGTVTSIATTSPITGGTITATGTIACATCVTSAASLTSTAIVTGAGSQGSQTPAATATMDTSGNISTPGSITTGAGGSVGGYSAYGQGTATTAPTSSVGWMGPASVTTKFMMKLPAAPLTGFLYNTGTSDPSTVSFVANIPVGNLNSGTGATSSTFWRGDGTWATPAGGGGSIFSNVVNTAAGVDFASTTYYISLTNSTTSTLNTYATSEAQLQMPMPVACTAKNMYIRTVDTTTGTHTFTLRKNGSGTALQVAVTGVAGIFSDTSDTVSLAAGDLVTIAHSAASGSVAFQSFSMLCQ